MLHLLKLVKIGTQSKGPKVQKNCWSKTKVADSTQIISTTHDKNTAAMSEQL